MDDKEAVHALRKTPSAVLYENCDLSAPVLIVTQVETKRSPASLRLKAGILADPSGLLISVAGRLGCQIPFKRMTMTQMTCHLSKDSDRPVNPQKWRTAHRRCRGGIHANALTGQIPTHWNKELKLGQSESLIDHA